VNESNATTSQTVTISSQAEHRSCTAVLPKSKVTACNNANQVTANGLYIFLSKNEEQALNYTYPNLNLFAGQTIELSLGHMWNDRDLQYKILSAPPGLGTQGKWIKLGKVRSNGYFTVNVALLINDNITGPLPTHEMYSPDPMTQYSKIHFRWQDENMAPENRWLYSGGVWLYNSQNAPICYPLLGPCN
jgi:hypothetical protein